MDLNFNKVFVAGRGLVGSAISRQLEAINPGSVISPSRSELEMTSQAEVLEFFLSEKPDYVVIAAAKVGGIFANNTYPAEFIYENLMVECNLIHSAFLAGCKNLLFLGSSCIYPRLAKQPIKEEYFLNGYLEPTNEPYAIAKIAGIKLCESYNRQHGCDYRSLMPTNLYGEGDNFHSENSHVIPALMSRIHEAKIKNEPSVTIWGTGSPKREFLYVGDLAEACIHIMSLDKSKISEVTQPMISHINVGTGIDVTIKELAESICEVVGFRGKLIFDSTKPDGMPRKLLDVTKINTLGWKAKTTLKDGLENSYHWFCENQQSLRI